MRVEWEETDGKSGQRRSFTGELITFVVVPRVSTAGPRGATMDHKSEVVAIVCDDLHRFIHVPLNDLRKY